MGATAHLDFIAAAYAAAVIIVGALLIWITLDYRAQLRTLAELDRQGVTRRSARGARAHDRTGQGSATHKQRKKHERGRQRERQRKPNESVKQSANLRWRRIVVLTPLVIFLALAALFLFRLSVAAILRPSSR